MRVRIPCIVLAFLFGMVVLPASAGVIELGSAVPPPESHYTSPDSATFLVSGGDAVLHGLEFVHPFPQTIADPPPGSFFDSFFDVFMELDIPFLGSGTLTGTGADVRYTPLSAGMFSTELITMDLTGTIGTHAVKIHGEGPTSGSAGDTQVTPQGGGIYHIDSFFDVFVELRIDNDPWIPGNAPLRETLSSVPLPDAAWAGMCLITLIVGYSGLRRWRSSED
jgi:hypothetical protein